MKWRDWVGLIVFAVLLLVGIYCRADVNLTGTAVNYGALGRGLTWAAGVNQNFILDLVSPSSGVCLNIRNNDSGTHTLTAITPAITSDRTVTTFTGNTGAWVATTIAPTAAPSIPGSTAANFFINTAGAAHLTISITGGSGTGTADLTYAQTPDQCGAGGVGSLAQAITCDRSNHQELAAAGNTVASIVPPAGQFVHVCAVTISSAATGGNVIFENGAAGTCAAPTGSLWGYVFNSNTAPGTGSGIGQLFKTSTAAQPLCTVVAGTLTSLFIDVSYTVF